MKSLKRLLQKSAAIRIANITILLSATLLSFQNCSATKFTTLEPKTAIENSSLSTCAQNPNHPDCVSSSSCTFNGEQYPEGSAIQAFLASSVPYGQACSPQVRRCVGGTFTGSYTYAECSPGAPTACLFNGRSITSGGSVTAYQQSTVPYGQICVSENRTCSNGALTGTYSFASCMAGAPANCLFNGLTVINGGSVKAYAASTVPYGSSCQETTRSCANGVLSGSAPYASCTVSAAASCLFNGQTVLSGGKVKAYQTASVGFGQTCVSQDRICTNGNLNGTYSFESCSVGAAASCNLNGQTLAHGASVKAYQNASVGFGQTCSSQDRICTNGTLAGTFTNLNCTVGTTPASCNFNGQTLAHGASVTAYSADYVPYGQSCGGQTRTCDNGTLSGSFQFGSCSAVAAANCNFNGQTIGHGGTIAAYASNSVAFGQNCQTEMRTCNNGAMTGSYTYGSCNVAAAETCNFNGQTIGHGGTIAAYATPTVSYGQNCQQQVRQCLNGTLVGNFNYGSCSPAAPSSCFFAGGNLNWGAYGCSVAAPALNLAHGETRSFASTADVAEGSIAYSCSNGSVQVSANSCNQKRCGTIEYTTPKCNVTTICANGNYISFKRDATPPARIIISGVVGQTVGTSASQVIPLESSMRLTKWNNLQLLCQSNGTWKQVNDGWCEMTVTVPNTDPRCQYSNSESP